MHSPALQAAAEEGVLALGGALVSSNLQVLLLQA
jgi:hypothetical protein